MLFTTAICISRGGLQAAECRKRVLAFLLLFTNAIYYCYLLLLFALGGAGCKRLSVASVYLLYYCYLLLLFTTAICISRGGRQAAECRKSTLALLLPFTAAIYYCYLLLLFTTAIYDCYLRLLFTTAIYY
jgi:hypothetical protein